MSVTEDRRVSTSPGRLIASARNPYIRGALGAAAVTLVVLGVAALTSPVTSLRSLGLGSVMIALAGAASSQVLCNGLWVYVLRRVDPSVRVWPGLLASTAALLGVVTPFGVGTDILRSLNGRRCLGVSYEVTIGTTVVTRTLKVYASLCIGFLVAISAAGGTAGVVQAAVAGMGSALLLLTALYSLRLRSWTRVTSALGIGGVSRSVREVGAHVNRWQSTIVLFGFLISFGLEWMSLHFCVLAVGPTPQLADTALLFGVLFCASRAAILPQGVGPTEIGGLLMLNTMQVGWGEAGAIIVLWNGVRFLVPLVLAVAASGLRA